MKKIKESLRIKYIENKWRRPIEKLFQQWHWQNNLKHKEIGKKLNIPRPTITRWFHQLKVPTQSCTRFTNNNLLYLGPNRLPKKPKLPNKPKERVPVNEEFFKKWSPEMAYVLGYFTADGCMFINPRGSRYVLFTSTDRELIYKIRILLESKHKIGIQKNKNPNWKDKYTLQIGSKRMFQDLLELNLTPNKSKTIRLPKVPKKYFNHFVRGYFDGDGCVFFNKYQRKTRKSPTYITITTLTSGNKQFLRHIFKSLQKYAYTKGGKIYPKSKNSGFELRFALNDSLKLYEFMYKSVPSNQFLERKYCIFQEILDHWGRRSIG